MAGQAMALHEHPKEKLVGIARRAVGRLRNNEITVREVVKHGSYLLEAVAVGLADGASKHYLGNGDAWEVMGVPIVGAGGAVLSLVSILGGADPWAGHVNNIGNCATACGASDWFQDLLKSAGK